MKLPHAFKFAQKKDSRMSSFNLLRLHRSFSNSKNRRRRADSHCQIRSAQVEILEDRTLLAAELVADLNQQPAPAGPQFGSFIDIGGTTYFTFDDGTHGGELWKMTSTPGSAVLVKDIFPGSESSMISSMINHN